MARVFVPYVADGRGSSKGRARPMKRGSLEVGSRTMDNRIPFKVW